MAQQAALLADIQAEMAKRLHGSDPVLWAEQRLGDTLWSRQQDILNAIKTHRRVAVKSCHEIGKSFIAGLAVGWFIDVSPVGDAFVVTSAPTAKQVEAILWKEIARVHTRGNLAGRLNTTEWKMRTSGGKEELVAFGRKPDEYDPTAFQGIHAPKVLVVFDESNGIRGGLWEAADSLIANDNSKILAIGNPDDPSGEFYEACKPGSGWYVIEISAFDSPNFTGEKMPKRVLDQLIGRTYVEEKRRKWAPNWTWTPDGKSCIPPPGVPATQTNPLWQSKVLGKFPENSEKGGLIPISWIVRAQQQTLAPVGPRKLGVDVGGGGDSSTVADRRGPVVRIIREDKNPDTMQTCGNVVADLEATGADMINIDMIGIGRGVRDRLLEQNKPVTGINVGEGAYDKEAFFNLKAELWWNVRTRFESGEIDIDPQDDDLAAELVEIRYKRTSSGKIQVESKDDAKKRGVPSPNRADALMLALAEPAVEDTSLTWGR